MSHVITSSPLISRSVTGREQVSTVSGRKHFGLVSVYEMMSGNSRGGISMEGNTNSVEGRTRALETKNSWLQIVALISHFLTLDKSFYLSKLWFPQL